MGKHAILSPSSASRWLVCSKSARLEEQFPDTDSDVAKEGTLAHKLAEIMLAHKLNMISDKEFSDAFREIHGNVFYDEAMFDYCSDYAAFVIDRFEKAKQHTSDATILLESEVDLRSYIEEGFGTIDNQIIADGVLEITDLKYGKGVPVSAENNKQMMVYALGALEAHDFLYSIKEVRMTIYQPRIDNITEWQVPVGYLKEWGDKELKPLAAKAFAGDGEFIPGEHCRFCRARATCRANGEKHMELAASEFAGIQPDLLSEETITEILGKADVIKNWLTAVEDYALKQAVTGKKWPGFKLVEGRSNRVYADEKKVATAVKKLGFKQDQIYTKKLLGIGAMEKLIGKTVFTEKLNGLVVKPEGKPTLIFESDKRPELDSTAAAIKDFEQIEVGSA
jgi:hypothetical protein